MFKRVIILVLDSVGIGAAPDAAEYGDGKVNTLANIARSQGGLFLPNLEKMGLGCIEDITGVKKTAAPQASYGKMAEISKGKDTTSGHWELAGCPLFAPFPVYPDGFPPVMIEQFTALTGRKILGNKVASGTEIIAELGAEHMRTGYPIVYTSADSVFQIAAHEEVIPLDHLYELCKIAREQVCTGEHAVGRIIARPFTGRPGEFVRTANRHDYSLTPPADTVLDVMKAAGYSVTGIGKIGDIFAHRGLTRSVPSKSNADGMEILTALTRGNAGNGLIMVNLVDFDSKYGHRNDVAGYAGALEQFDEALGRLLPAIAAGDLLLITADHGCDPTAPGTDHTREYVPLMAYAKDGRGQPLGTRSTFADVAATVAANFGLPPFAYGTSFLSELL
ncbi:phosphopentomutase|uniref:Phosphopentomutase n=1 Tax=Dendrosporobacter quercicolus TaxID=146817 RepID=A0A1G9L1F3_9FIRM|nr:phosphopentomutase [Dendrosporobacter quercicolus]NSL46551.1 phosphopentomutase [Dendrosporobacter quercicolus DSM 1736]SDL55415.1 phosphopentomutase [Dendrosporobacter quercicolus]